MRQLTTPLEGKVIRLGEEPVPHLVPAQFLSPVPPVFNLFSEGSVVDASCLPKDSAMSVYESMTTQSIPPDSRGSNKQHPCPTLSTSLKPRRSPSGHFSFIHLQRYLPATLTIPPPRQSTVCWLGVDGLENSSSISFGDTVRIFPVLPSSRRLWHNCYWLF